MDAVKIGMIEEKESGGATVPAALQSARVLFMG
jgi:hypothetical protein